MVDLSKNNPFVENENPAIRSNQEHGTEQSIRRQKGVEIHPIVVGVEARLETFWKPPPEKLVVRIGKKVYRPSLSYTYK